MDLFPAETRTFENALRSSPSLYERPATFLEAFESAYSYQEDFSNVSAYGDHRLAFVQEWLEAYEAAGNSRPRVVPEIARRTLDRETRETSAAAQQAIDQALGQIEAAGGKYPSEEEIHAEAIRRMGEAHASNLAFAQRPQGVGPFFGDLLGSAFGYVRDPFQAVTLMVGGGGGSVARIAAREFVVNASVETFNQALAFEKKQEAAPSFGIDDAGSEVLFAGAIGAGFGAIFGTAGKLIREAALRRETADALKVLEREAEIARSNPLEPTAPAAAAHRAALDTAAEQINRGEPVDVDEIVAPHRVERTVLSEERAARLEEVDPGLSAERAKAADIVEARRLEADDQRIARDSINEADVIEQTDEVTAERLRAIDQELDGTIPAKRRNQLEAEREAIIETVGDLDRQVSDLLIGPNKRLKRLEKQLRKAEADLRRVNKKANDLLDDLDAANAPPPRQEPEAAPRVDGEDVSSEAPEAPQAPAVAARASTPAAAASEASPTPSAPRPPPEAPGRPQESLQAPEEARAPEAAPASPETAADPRAAQALDQDVERVLEEREFDVVLADDEGGSRTVTARQMMEEADEEIQQVKEIMTCAVGGKA